MLFKTAIRLQKVRFRSSVGCNHYHNRLIHHQNDLPAMAQTWHSRHTSCDDEVMDSCQT